MVPNPLSFSYLNIQSPSTSRMGNTSSSSQETLQAVEHSLHGHNTNNQGVNTTSSPPNLHDPYENLMQHLTQNGNSRERVGDRRTGNKVVRGGRTQLREDFEAQDPFVLRQDNQEVQEQAGGKAMQRISCLRGSGRVANSYQHFEGGEAGVARMGDAGVYMRFGAGVDGAGRMEVRDVGVNVGVNREVAGETERGEKDWLSVDQRQAIEKWIDACEMACSRGFERMPHIEGSRDLVIGEGETEGSIIRRVAL